MRVWHLHLIVRIFQALCENIGKFTYVNLTHLFPISIIIVEVYHYLKSLCVWSSQCAWLICFNVIFIGKLVRLFILKRHGVLVMLPLHTATKYEKLVNLENVPLLQYVWFVPNVVPVCINTPLIAMYHDYSYKFMNARNVLFYICSNSWLACE